MRIYYSIKTQKEKKLSRFFLILAQIAIIFQKILDYQCNQLAHPLLELLLFPGYPAKKHRHVFLIPHIEFSAGVMGETPPLPGD